jgi:hypothetical protein
MKNCICCLSILILISLVACTGSEESVPSEQVKLETIDPTTRLGQVIEVTTSTSMDSVLVAEIVEKERTTNLKLAQESVKAIKAVYEKGETVGENYIESIPFTSFIGNSVELGALEVIQLKDQYTRVYADYFDGEPIGGKLFFIKNNALVAIEVIQIKEQITENGASILEESTYILYYHEEALLSITDLSTNEIVETSSIGWLDENLADWELVKRNLNTL